MQEREDLLDSPADNAAVIAVLSQELLKFRLLFVFTCVF